MIEKVEIKILPETCASVHYAQNEAFIPLKMSSTLLMFIFHTKVLEYHTSSHTG